jgi:hypothetical protein
MTNIEIYEELLDTYWPMPLYDEDAIFDFRVSYNIHITTEGLHNVRSRIRAADLGWSVIYVSTGSLGAWIKWSPDKQPTQDHWNSLFFGLVTALRHVHTELKNIGYLLTCTAEYPQKRFLQAATICFDVARDFMRRAGVRF